MEKELVKCKHCGEIFEGDFDGASFEFPEEYEKSKKQGLLIHHQHVGKSGFCPKCRKYSIMIHYNRRKQQTQIQNAMQPFTYAGKIKDWKSWIDKLPKVKGVYAVTRENDETPNFVEKGTGAFVKKDGKFVDPNVSTEELAKQWYYTNDKIMYIGRAGYDNKPSESNIHDRVRTYMRFGNGKQAKHWGGRYIWQMEDVGEFDVWFMACDDPETKECKLINKYLPFANLDIPKFGGKRWEIEI